MRISDWSSDVCSSDLERVLIAFDRDEAGERGAAAVAERLMATGIACFRILFPKGMDANAYALAVTPASRSLGVLIRKADRKSVGTGTSVSVRVDLGGCSVIKKKKQTI